MERLPAELLNALPALLAAAQGLSASQTAAQLSTTTSTVLRRIEAAEGVLQVRLFHRLPTGLVPTPALEAILPWAEHIALGVDGMRREVASLDSGAGLVRLSTPPVVAELFLVPNLPALRGYPELTVDFSPDSKIANLDQQEADLAVRVIRPTGGDLLIKKLYDYSFVIAGTPSLGDVPERWRWLTWNESMCHLPEAVWLNDALPDAKISLRSSKLSTLLSAAKHGLGALVVAEPMAAQVEGLVQLPHVGPPLPRGSLWMVRHRALRSVPRLNAVASWVSECFQGASPNLPALSPPGS